MSQKKLILLDGHALVYRAHYAFISRPLINSKGWNTSAITGFVRTLWDLIKNQGPSHIAVSFDLKGPTFRHELYEPYKANREAQPEDITFALPYIKKIIEAFRIPVVSLEGYEADDVIGTLAKQAEKEGFQVFMVTPDKDYAQLVSENIFMYKPSRNGNDAEIIGIPEVLEKWGINRVDQVIDMLGLQGDSVDNIPGIPGVGPKTAVKLLAEYDTVDGIIANSDKLKGKLKERVETNAELARLSKTLATIDINVPVKFDAKEYEICDFDRAALTSIFKELEFRTLATAILSSGDSLSPSAAPSPSSTSGQGSLFGDKQPVKVAPPVASKVSMKPGGDIENTAHEYHLTDSSEKREELITLLSKQKEICFDTETTGLDANQAELVGIAFSVKAHQAYYVPIPEQRKKAEAILSEFKGIFEDDKILKIGQNIKYDALILKWYGIEVKGKYFDTMLAHYLLEPELRHNMNYMAETYLKYTPVSIESLIGKGKHQLSMRDVPIEKVYNYAAEDADVTFQLKDYFQPDLKAQSLDKLYFEIEEPLVNVLVDLEYEGINLNADFLNKYSTELEQTIKDIEEGIYESAGMRFNIASPKQVGQVLFDHLEIPYRWRTTKTGQYSTNEEKLTELAKEYEIVEDILEFRGFAKLKSTYVDALPKMVNPKTGRIHSSFNQALAATGRLSSNNPNLQNIPIRTKEGREVRKAFIPRDKDHILLAADYSQIELRLIAEISGDEAMLEAFKLNQDIHRATAAKVYGVDYNDVTADQRRNAKTVNFSIIYGAGATNLSRQLDIKRTEARALIDQYFKQYHGLKKYMDDTIQGARENGYVSTLMGRKRHLRDINSKNGMNRSFAERIAVNTPIQGSAADMIKIAMINIHRTLKEKNLGTKMILQVHDELVFDVPKSELETVSPLINDLMKNAIPNLKVPIIVGVDTGLNWLEAH